MLASLHTKTRNGTTQFVGHVYLESAPVVGKGVSVNGVPWEFAEVVPIYRYEFLGERSPIDGYHCTVK